MVGSLKRCCEQRFLAKFSEYIDNESNNFTCNCNTYGNHKNLIIFCNMSAIFDLLTTVFGCSCDNVDLDEI